MFLMCVDPPGKYAPNLTWCVGKRYFVHKGEFGSDNKCKTIYYDCPSDAGQSN